MKRREAFKKIGLFGIIGLSGMAITACATEEKPAPNPSIMEATPKPKPKSEREKLIINRTHNTFADPKNPTKAELKHTPEISFGEQDEKGNTLVNVTIGSEGIIHPAEENHWIDYMNVYVNDVLIIETEFKNTRIRGYGSYYLSLVKGDIVLIESGCNLHGIWDNSKTY